MPAEYAGLIKIHGSIEAFLDRMDPLPPKWEFFRRWWQQDERLRRVGTFTLAYVAWPWIALVTLMIFRASMRKAKVRPGHVMRCTIYSADALPMLVAVLLAGMLPFLNRVFRTYSPDLLEQRLWWLALVILWGTCSWRLIRAYELYLKFDHAWGVVLAVQVIFFLTLIQFTVSTQGFDSVRNLLLIRWW